MKKINQSDKELIIKFASISLSLIFAIIVFFFAEFISARIKVSYLNGIAREQMSQIENRAFNLQGDDRTVEQALEKLKTSNNAGSTHWFLYSMADKKIVFERNLDETTRIGNADFSEMSDYYIRNGGKGVSGYFEKINEGEVFSAIVTKNERYGRELISCVFINIGGEQYCLGRGVSESYILSIGEVSQNTIILRIASLSIGGIMIVIICFFAITYNSKSAKIRSLTIEITEKNALIQAQENNMTSLSIGITDESTGLYTKEFFSTIIAKLEENPIDNVGIIIIRVKNLDEIKYQTGYDFAMNLMGKISETILNASDQSDICASLGSSEYGIITFETDDIKIENKTENLSILLNEASQPLEIAFGNSTNVEGLSIKAVLTSAYVSLDE